MKIKMYEIPIREIITGYEDNEIGGVVGFHGKLNIHPAYQREFIYKDKQRDEVINTVMKKFPLNVMYWVWTDATDENQFPEDFNGLKEGNFELLDGQQRTISICQYRYGEFSVNYRGYDNLTPTEKEEFLKYKLTVYVCIGDDKEKLDWFEIINIAGEELYPQELKNAIYSGPWVTEMKKWFSRPGCPAKDEGDRYLSGSPIRQDYLETVLKWISERDGIDIREYMRQHQHITNASEEWLYFQSVINWVKTIFPNYRKEMKGINWGHLYNKYKDVHYDPAALEKRIVELFLDDDLSNHKGIYEFLLSGETEEKHLSFRVFDSRMRRYAYELQKHKCIKCGKTFEIEQMEADHITPWSKGGKTIQENCQMLCVDCNRRKSDH